MLADGRFLNLSDSLVIAIAIQSTLLLQLSIKLNYGHENTDKFQKQAYNEKYLNRCSRISLPGNHPP